MRTMVLLALLTGCATEAELTQQRQAQLEAQQAREAEAQAKTAAERKKASDELAGWFAFCGVERQPQRTYAQEMKCAWYMFTYCKSEGLAVPHWVAAAHLAKARDELCPPVVQIDGRSVHPKQDLEGLDEQTVANCLAQSKDQARRAATAPQQQCLAACRQQFDACYSENELGLSGQLFCRTSRSNCDERCR